jgi:hypothetical protein
MRLLGLTLILAVSLVLGLQADTDKPQADGKGEVARLVEQLGSKQFSRREAAARSLLEIGSPALEALRKAMASPDIEVRQRATELVRQIEQRTETQLVLKPTRVRLVCKDQPLPAAVEELARKAGMPLKLQGNAAKLAEQKITLDTGETSFWNALDQLCRKAGLVEEAPPAPRPPAGGIHGSTILVIGGGGVGIGGPGATPKDILKAPVEETRPILLIQGKPSSLPAELSTAIRVRLLPADAKVPWKKEGDDLLLGLEANPEPRILSKGSLGVRINKAIDDQGQQLVALPPPQIEENRMPGQRRANVVKINQVQIDTNARPDDGKQGPIPVRLKKGARPAKQLKELSGTVLALVQSAPETLVTIDDVLKAKDKTIKGPKGGSVKVLDASRKEDGEIKLRLRVEAPFFTKEEAQLPLPGNVQVFVNGELLGQKKQDPLSTANFALLDEAGKPFKVVKAVNTGVRVGATQEVELTYQPEAGQKVAARFTYIGRRTTAIEVPFTLKDVPLP